MESKSELNERKNTENKEEMERLRKSPEWVEIITQEYYEEKDDLIGERT